MAKIFCSNCGKALNVPEGRAFTFCTECGTKVEVPAAFVAAPKVEIPKEAAPAVEAVKEAAPVVETVKEAAPAVEAVKEAAPVVETVKEAAPAVDTVKVETPRPAPAPQPRPAPAPQPEAPAQEKPKKKKGLLIGIIIGAVVLVLAAAAAVFMFIIKPGMDYSAATKLLEDKSYEEATAAFEKLGTYKDSALKADEARLGQAVKLVASGKIDKASKLLKEIESDDVDYDPLNEAIGEAIAKLAAEGDYEGVAETVDAFGKYVKDTDGAIAAGVAALIEDKEYYSACYLIDYLTGEDAIEDVAVIRAAVTEKFKALVDVENIEDATDFFYALSDYTDDVSGIANEKIAKLLEAGEYAKAKELIDYIYWSIDNPAKAVTDKAEALVNAGDLEGALELAKVVEDHNEYKAIVYSVADKYFANEDYAKAAELFGGLGWYEDSEERAKAARSKIALDLVDKEDMTAGEYAEVYGALVDSGAEQDVIDAFIVRWAEDTLESGDSEMASKLYYSVTLPESAEEEVYAVVLDNLPKVATVNSKGEVTANEDQIAATKEILDLFSYYYEDVADIKSFLNDLTGGASFSAAAVKAIWNVEGMRDIATSELGLSGALVGSWKSADEEYGIEMTERGNGTFNFNYELPAGDLPSNTASWYMGGDALVLIDSDGADIQKFVSFTFTDYDHVSVYCYNTEKTVELMRVS